MKAIIQNKYGPAELLKVEDIEKPRPKENEVLIHVKATALNAPDWRLLRGKPFFMRLVTGILRPKDKIKGCEFSGEIVEINQNVSEFKVGDLVIGDLSDAGLGAFADYVCVNKDLLAYKPNSLSHIEAAALPLTAVTALQGVRDVGEVKSGESVLLVGASGGVGTYALQLSKHFGAFVTAVTSERSEKQAKELGADEVVLYTKVPLEGLEKKFDLIIAVNGYNKLKTYKKLLKEKGRFVMIGGKSIRQILFVTAFAGLLSRKNGKKFKALLAKQSAKDLTYIAELADKKMIKVVIEKTLSFAEIPKGIIELEKGHVGGKIVAWVNQK